MLILSCLTTLVTEYCVVACDSSTLIKMTNNMLILSLSQTIAKTQQ